MIRVGAGLAVVALLGCSTPTKRAEPVVSAAPAPSAAVQPVDVWLLPLDDFSYEASTQLASALRKDLQLQVRSTVVIGAAGLQPMAGTSQYSGEALMEVVERTIPNLGEKHEKTVFILLTTRDINLESRALRYSMAVHNKAKRVGVVSAARMAAGVPSTEEGHKLVFTRFYKMTKRLIGDLYYNYPRSSDIRDVMYAPIMSVDVLDKMGTEYLNKENIAEPLP